MIGGGPAGGAAARLLAGLGWHTALVERAARDRAKACGECLSPRAARLLDRWHLLEDVRRLASGTTRRFRVHLEARAPLAAGLPASGATGPGLLVQRCRFDQFLADAAKRGGVDVLRPATARVEAARGGPLVEVRAGGRRRLLRAGLVVGADGLRSAVARAAGLALRAAGRKYGFALDVPDDGQHGIEPGTIEMFVGADGYLGVVRRAGRLHAAGLVSRAIAPETFLASTVRRFPPLARTRLAELPGGARRALLGAGPIPCRPAAVAAGRVALVGDAAGYHEPFTGEGMTWSLESAEILAGVAAGVAPGGWTRAAARAYRRAWRARLGGGQRLCRLLAAVIERPRCAAALCEAARRRPSIAAWIAQRAVGP